MTSKTGAIALLFFFRSGLVRRKSLELFLLILLSFAGRHVYVKGGRDGNVGEVEVERIEEREIVEGMGQSQGATRSIFLALGTPFSPMAEKSGPIAGEGKWKRYRQERSEKRGYFSRVDQVRERKSSSCINMVMLIL